MVTHYKDDQLVNSGFQVRVSDYNLIHIYLTQLLEFRLVKQKSLSVVQNRE